MRCISAITRRDIIDVICYGFVVVDDVEIKMTYWGRLDEIAFLQRIYPLAEMPSYDNRYASALGDIRQHTVNNNDWDDNWVFSDDRFHLGNGSEDEPLLNFLCEMFHPFVRNEKEPWGEFLIKFNELLAPDGYELYEKSHISGRAVYGYHRLDFIETDPPIEFVHAELKTIGSGSYATVSKYYDKRYDRWFAVKKAKQNLDDKELIRFRREFDDMKKLNSPYIVEVYTYDVKKNQYIMELMSESIEKYVLDNNANLACSVRINLIMQTLRAIEYIHTKGYYHRDICPKNILIKKYDDTIVVKLSDFGLVKENNSELTSDSTDIKGYYNDPALQIEGFKNYGILHEIYALTRLVVFILTGKNNYDKIRDAKIKSFLAKGTNPDKSKRFPTIDELRQAVRLL